MTVSTLVLPNSSAAIKTRQAAGAITWPRTLGMLVSRTLLFAAWQAVFAAIFAGQGQAHPWEASITWWPVTVVLANLTSLVLLVWAGKKEGLRLMDFYRVEKHSFWRELPIFILLTLLSVPLAMLPNTLLGNLLFGDVTVTQDMMFRALPSGVVYACLILLPITITFSELPTYFGYVLPRLKALSGSTWLAVILSASFLALQHVAFPLIFDWRFILWRMLMFLPFALYIGAVLNWRPRLLPYFMVVHGLMDASLFLFLLPIAY